MKVYDTESPEATSVLAGDLEPGLVYKVSVMSVLRRVESPEEPPGGIIVSMRMLNYGLNLLHKFKI